MDPLLSVTFVQTRTTQGKQEGMRTPASAGRGIDVDPARPCGPEELRKHHADGLGMKPLGDGGGGSKGVGHVIVERHPVQVGQHLDRADRRCDMVPAHG